MKETIIRVFQDGDQVCALIGENLQEGVAGFAASKKSAVRDLLDRITDNYISSEEMKLLDNEDFYKVI